MTPAEPRDDLVQLLLRRGIRRGDPATGGAAPVGPGGPDRAPLSRDQLRLWLTDQIRPGTARHNVAVELRPGPPPNKPALEAALAELQRTHAALRLRVVAPPGREPYQEVVPAPPVPLAWHDLTGRPAAAAAADALARAEAARPLDAGRPPLYRATALVTSDRDWRLVVVLSHLVVDGWSVGVLVDDLDRALAGEPIPQPAWTFLDQVRLDRGRPVPDRVLDHWRAVAATDLPATTLAPAGAGAADRDARGGLVPLSVGRETTAGVRTLARRLGVTPYAVGLAAFHVLLRRVTEPDTIVLGAPASSREHPRLDRVVGFLVRTVLLRTEVRLDDAGEDVVRAVHRSVGDTLAHQPMPLEDLVRLAGRSGPDGPDPLFRTMFAWHETPAADGRAAADLDTGTAKFDLTLALTLAGDRLGGSVEWSAAGADRTTAAAVAAAYPHVLADLVRRPGTRVRDLELRPPTRPDPAEPARDRSRRVGLCDGLSDQAGRTPDAPALVEPGGRTLGYADLARAVAASAAGLRRAGVRPGDRVALVLQRSTDLVVAVHAVTAVGAAYVPLDTAAPPARMRHLLTAAEVRLVLTHRAARDRVPVGPWTVLDLGAAGRSDLPTGQLRPVGVPAGGPAYLLYTSGTTGGPKPVEFPADSSQAFLDWLGRLVPAGPEDAVLLKTPYGFDVSVWELFWPLQRGARLVLTEPTGHLDPGHLADLVRRHGVTVANFVPSMLEAFLDDPAAASCRSLRWILSAGEPLTAALRDRVHARLPGVTLLNLYGPTECGAVTAHELSAADTSPVVPIGRPAPYARLRITDQAGRELPAGLHGELQVGGELATANGYRGRPALTARRFVPDPDAPRPGLRLYRTGDLCRRLPDGTYQHLGRMDRQTKVRGVRIEPAEIENLLTAHPAVAAVRVAPVDGGAGLAAFYTVRPGWRVGAETLRELAAAGLPSHLVPDAFVPVDRIEVTGNGKTDLAALERAWRDHRDPAAREPAVGSGPVLEQVRSAVEQVLGRPVPDPDAGFFELGGDSFLLLRLADVLAARPGPRVGVSELARRPTVRGISLLYGGGSADGGAAPVPLAPAPGAPGLVLVHPAAGSVLPYVPLARAVGPRLSVHGLAAPACRPLPRTVAGFAELLRPQVAGLARSGPLLLAGWSFGGLIAYELAAAARREGRPGPAAVLLLDTWLPGAGPAAAESGAAQLAFLRERSAVPADLSGGDRSDLEAVLDATAAAFAGYRPAPVGGVPVHLLLAAGGYPGAVPAGYGAPARGWTAVVPDVTVTAVPGDHFTLLSPAHAPALAGHVQAAALAALSEGSP